MLRALNSLQLKLFKVSNHRRALLKTSGPRGPVALVAFVPGEPLDARKVGAGGSSDCTLGSEAPHCQLLNLLYVTLICLLF